MVQQKADRSMVSFPTERFLISSLSSWNLKKLKRLCLNLAGQSERTVSGQIKYCVSWKMLNGHANMWLFFEAMNREINRRSPGSFKRKENWHAESRHLSPSKIVLSKSLTQLEPHWPLTAVALSLPLSIDDRSGRRDSSLSLRRCDLGILRGISNCIFLKYILSYIRIRFSNSICHGLGLQLTYCINTLFVLFIWQTTSSVLNNCLKMEFWGKNVILDNFVNCSNMNASKDRNCFLPSLYASSHLHMSD